MQTLGGIDLEMLQSDPDLVYVNRKMFLVEQLVLQAGTPNSRIKAAVISGPPGIGKSHTTLQVLGGLEKKKKIQLTVMKGQITPYQLYELLLANSMTRSVVVLDDMDSAFNAIPALNILKAAIDPSAGYKVAWGSRAASAPSFTFLGKLIILTNYNVGASVHFTAFADRIHCMPLEFTPRQIYIKLVEIALDQMKLDKDLTSQMVDEVVEWLEIHRTGLRQAMSYRTLVTLFNLRIALGPLWAEMAENTLK